MIRRAVRNIHQLNILKVVLFETVGVGTFDAQLWHYNYDLSSDCTP